jgi:hypothetical protein
VESLRRPQTRSATRCTAVSSTFGFRNGSHFCNRPNRLHRCIIALLVSHDNARDEPTLTTIDGLTGFLSRRGAEQQIVREMRARIDTGLR